MVKSSEHLQFSGTPCINLSEKENEKAKILKARKCAFDNDFLDDKDRTLIILLLSISSSFLGDLLFCSSQNKNMELSIYCS